MPTGPDLSAKIAAALSEASDIRHPTDGLLPSAIASAEPVALEVLIVAAAVSLSENLALLEQAVRRVRREFRRSRWQGKVEVLLYTGALGNVPPDESALARLRTVPGIDTILALGDTNDLGRRIRWEDAARAAGEFLAYRFTCGHVPLMTAKGAVTARSPTPVVAFSIFRIDLSEATAWEDVRAATYRRVVAAMFAPRTTPTNPGGPQIGDAITDEVLSGLYKATNGSVAEVGRAVAARGSTSRKRRPATAP